MAGMGQTPMGLVMAYLQKVEQKDGRRIVADRRIYGGDGAPRAVSTWEEAHAVFLEIEGGREPRRQMSGEEGDVGGDGLAEELEEGAGSGASVECASTWRQDAEQRVEGRSGSYS